MISDIESRRMKECQSKQNSKKIKIEHIPDHF